VQITITTITTTTYHNITILTISPLSQYHHYHNITTITTVSIHHYHNITTITISPLSEPLISQSPLSQYHNYHKITIITTTKITIIMFTISPLWQYHQHHNHHHHNHHYQGVSHESFVVTSATFKFWGKSRTKASFLHLPLSLFEGSLARNALLKVSRCTKCCLLQDKTCPGGWMGNLSGGRARNTFG